MDVVEGYIIIIGNYNSITGKFGIVVLDYRILCRGLWNHKRELCGIIVVL